MRRALLALPFLLALGIAGAAAPAGSSGGATARAYGIQILQPGQPAHGTTVLAAPRDAVQFGGAFAFPDDGSIVSAATVTLSVSAAPGTIASASASSEVTTLKLFNGEVTA